MLSITKDDLLGCCGSRQWVRCMMESQPFHNSAEVLEAAERVWWDLRPADWLEAFAAHPRIGEKSEDRRASQEQSGVAGAAFDTIAELAAGNRNYEEKFGYIYIVCASGRSASEMLDILESRLGNDPDRELRIAAEQQLRITLLRLEKWAERSMSGITTHILDTSRGHPAAGVPVKLHLQSAGGSWKQLGRGVTDSDGRLGGLLTEPIAVGIYRLTFETRSYSPEGLYPEVIVTFEVRDTARHYHIPLLLSPYGYTTYRGS